MRGTKKPGTPNAAADAALTRLNVGRTRSSADVRMNGLPDDTRSQNSRRRGDAVAPAVARDQRGVDGADGHAGDPIRCDARFGETLVDAGLIGAERPRPAARRTVWWYLPVSLRCKVFACAVLPSLGLIETGLARPEPL